MNNDLRVILQTAIQLIKLLGYEMNDDEIIMLSTYEMVELFLRTKNQKQLYCFIGEDKKPCFTKFMVLEQMSVCTKKMPVDMFSLSKPMANLHFSVVKPDIKFNL